MPKLDELILRCPDCGCELRVDTATGQVLSHRSAGSRSPAKDFDSLLAGIDEGKKRADEVFRQEVAALDDRERLLEEKFRRAFERVEEEDDGSPPVRPWDLD